MKTQQFDVVIVGGGVVGATLACLLARNTSLSIAVLEARAEETAWSAQQYHHRVSAITLASSRIFQTTGVWEEIKRKRVSPFTNMHVWDAKTAAAIDFQCEAIGEEVLGYIIENVAIQASLQAVLKTYPQITFFPAIELHRVEETVNSILLYATNMTFRAQLAVAADGAQSWLREAMQIEVQRHEYQESALVTTVETEKPHHACAQQVFLECGPLAFLPLAEKNLSSIVWSLPKEKAQAKLNMPANEFKEVLANAFEYRLGDVTRIEKRFCFPLIKQQAKHYIAPRVALVGDAAHTIHPLAGQGVNMGLLDAASLHDVLVSALAEGRNIASQSTLRRYERWRKADNAGLMLGVDGIKKLFANEWISVSSLRALGLEFTQKVNWLKNMFIRHAVGNRTDLPAAAIRK